jgi:hypothetical protein
VADDTLYLTPKTLIVFIDETGNEDLSDPKNPTFGRGGCAAIGPDYPALLKKPWRSLKRERLGGATKPFHAADFERSKPTNRQIQGINRFLMRPFWRFAVMCDHRTALPAGVDVHKAVSLVTTRFIARLAQQYDIENVALVFESSDRGDRLVQRDFDLANMDVRNMSGRRIEVDGLFMPKTSMEPGLEIADLVAHTASRQRRHELRGNAGRVKDFEQMYWHSPIPPAFMAIDNVQLSSLALDDNDL